MSEDPYPIVKRIFLAQPRKRQYSSHWNARQVDNANITDSARLDRPPKSGWAHEPFELYYHESVVNELKEEIKFFKAKGFEKTRLDGGQD